MVRNLRVRGDGISARKGRNPVGRDGIGNGGASELGVPAVDLSIGAGAHAPGGSGRAALSGGPQVPAAVAGPTASPACYRYWPPAPSAPTRSRFSSTTCSTRIFNRVPSEAARDAATRAALTTASRYRRVGSGKLGIFES